MKSNNRITILREGKELLYLNESTEFQRAKEKEGEEERSKKRRGTVARSTEVGRRKRYNQLRRRIEAIPSSRQN